MNLQINCTKDGTKIYPLHSHKNPEIIYYLSGNGYLRTENKNYPFSPGTIMIVPGNIAHGSASKSGFKNICVCGEFECFINSNLPIILTDNERNEGKILAELIYYNRSMNSDYLISLCISYVQFLCRSIEIDDDISIAVKNIITEISANAYDCRFSLNKVLANSGYSKDYIRHCFKKKTGKTPTEFLTETRIKHACHLIDIYKNTLTIAQIAEQCGFLDYIYFSKRFKEITGVSPSVYRKHIH